MRLLDYIPKQIRRRLAERFDPTADRIQQIVKKIDSSDTVLDIGCVRHSLDKQQWQSPPPGEFLHADLARRAGRTVGLDVLKEEVERMREAGYDARVSDAEQFDLDETFDVIVAGELIEHLSNPGRFLDCSYRHLEDDGRLILTTPNPRRFHMLLWYVLGIEYRANREHTLWLDNYVIEELARRSGFEVVDWSWYRPGYRLSTNILYLLGVNSLGGGGFIFELRKIS